MKPHAYLRNTKERYLAALAAVCVSAALFASVGVSFEDANTTAGVGIMADTIVVVATRLI